MFSLVYSLAFGVILLKLYGNVLICYHFFAHYREPVLRRLSSMLGPHNLILAADLSDGRGGEIPNISEEVLREICVFHRLHNCYFRGILFQAGLLKLIFRLPVSTPVIFLGDAKYITTWIATVIHRIRGGKVLFWTHGTRRPLTGLRGMILRLFYSLPSRLLLYGDRARSLLEDAGITTPSTVIFNSLDFDLQCKMTKDTGPVRRDRGKLLFCARLSRNKRVDVLIEAVHILLEQGIDISLDIVGDGPCLNELKELVSNYSIEEKVNFHGSIYEEDKLARIFLAASIFVVPEAAGLSVMHAMAYGLPVITSDDECIHMPESEAIVQGITGGFFVRANAKSLAQEIKYWLDKVGPDVSDACVEMIKNKYSSENQGKLIIGACME